MSSTNVPYSLSFFDLLQYPLFKMAARLDDTKLMKTIFYEAGLDVSKGFEIIERLHRPVTSNQPWKGLRVEGFERLDRDYIQNMRPSLDAVIASSGDESLIAELRSLNPQCDKSVFDDEKECGVDIPDVEYTNFKEEDKV